MLVTAATFATRFSMSFFLYGIVTLPTSVTCPCHLRVHVVENREVWVLQHLFLDVTEQLQVFAVCRAGWRADHQERGNGCSHQFG